MRLVCISDTHGKHGRIPPLPDGDVLVVAGDITNVGSRIDVMNFNDWIQHRPHKNKVVIAGNHDWLFHRKKNAPKLMTNCTYLQDSGVTIDGIKFWGSPWQPRFYDWAFNLDRGAPLKKKWAEIPKDTDVLITHGPPAGILDLTEDHRNTGCVDLLDAVNNIRPKIHVFGHIHEAYGKVERGSTIYVNASSCTRQYSPTNSAIIVNI